MRLLFLLIPFLLSCNLSDIDTKKTGLHKVSSTINQSKENGVFLHALQVDKASIRIGGNQLDTIQEAWMETSWRYETQDGKTIVQKDAFNQLAIRFQKLPTETYNIWIKRGAKSLAWTAVASGSTTQGKFYVVEKLDAGRENILDSFTLRQ
jgi:hypothetical protein